LKRTSHNGRGVGGDLGSVGIIETERASLAVVGVHPSPDGNLSLGEPNGLAELADRPSMGDRPGRHFMAQIDWLPSLHTPPRNLKFRSRRGVSRGDRNVVLGVQNDENRSSARRHRGEGWKSR